jgi:putative ABC transport system permease protein
MKYFQLVWASLFRKKTRTLLTVLSLAMAFLLFGLLQAVNVLFSAPPTFAGADRLIVQSRVSFTEALPLAMRQQLRTVPGIEAITWRQWFGGIYQEPRNFFPQFATDPATFREVYPEYVMPEEQWRAFETTRTGAIVGRRLAERFGWQVGDKVPIQSTIWPQRDGNKTWTFDIVGIYDGRDEETRQRTGVMWINFDYFDEARQFARGLAGIYDVRVADAGQANAIAQAIDSLFANSPNETKTQSERDFQLGFFKQIGDIGLIVTLILIAVFFTILILTGNTMAQAVRERIPELAVLKTLGFPNGLVTALVLAEALLLCAIGGLAGMGLAQLIATGLARLPDFPPVPLNLAVWTQALVAIVALALAVGLPPALRAGRLRIVDALAGR